MRVGRVGGNLVANPSEDERAQSDIDIIMAANRDSIFMVEGGGKEVSEEAMIEALGRSPGAGRPYEGETWPMIAAGSRPAGACAALLA